MASQATSSVGGGGATSPVLSRHGSTSSTPSDHVFSPSDYDVDGRAPEGGPVRHTRIPKVVSKTFDSSTQACQHCRKRKRKCDRLTPACSNCAKAKIPCIFDLRVTDKTHPGYVEGLISQIDTLTARVAWLERLVGALGVDNIHTMETGVVPILPLQQSSNPNSQPYHSPRPPLSSCSSQASSAPPSTINESNMNTPEPYLDDDKPTSPFARVTKQILRLQAQDSSPTFLVDATPLGRCGPDRSTTPTELDPSDVQLPVYEDALLMMDGYFNNNGVVYPFLEKNQFKSELDALYQMNDPFPSSPSRAHRQRLFRILLVFAIGTTNVAQIPGGTAWGTSTSYYRRALQELDWVLEREDIDCVQNLLLLCIFTTFNVEGPSLWSTLGSTIRLAIGLGLHRRIGPDRASPFELERRRRTWWSIYNFDRVASFTLGRPLGIADEAIDIELPSLDTEQGTGNHFISYTHHIIRQRRLYGIVVRDVYSVSPSSSPTNPSLRSAESAVGVSTSAAQDIVSSIHTLAEQWYNSTPKPLRTTPPGKGHTNKLYFAMAFNLIICALYRPSPLLPTPSREQLGVLRRASGRCLDCFWDLHRRRRIAVNHVHLLQMFTCSISLLYCLCEYALDELNLGNRAWRRRTVEVVGRVASC
ncbi:hypothetical protein BDZ89DRAFT_328219 [Hymenopellis radicata]|nr:hypothetical protein BDZ89DRAFT_328219 [Hymenopellis radicata]